MWSSMKTFSTTDKLFLPLNELRTHYPCGFQEDQGYPRMSFYLSYLQLHWHPDNEDRMWNCRDLMPHSRFNLSSPTEFLICSHLLTTECVQDTHFTFTNCPFPPWDYFQTYILLVSGNLTFKSNILLCSFSCPLKRYKRFENTPTSYFHFSPLNVQLKLPHPSLSELFSVTSPCDRCSVSLNPGTSYFKAEIAGSSQDCV